MLFVQCKETNWQENYREREKSPFGTYIIFNEMSSLLDDEKVHYLKENVQDYLVEYYINGEEKISNYICIKNTAHKLDDEAVNELLNFVSDGNTAFMALNSFPEYLQEKLEFETKTIDSLWNSNEELKYLSGDFTLINEALKTKNIRYKRNIRGHYFSSFESNNTVVLGTQEINSIAKANFIKIYYGNGIVYLHSQPIAFTNYYMLQETVAYAEKVFSYLPSRNTLWDPQIHESSESRGNDDNKDSVFKYFLAHPSLKWSLYLAFSSLLLFMLFNARRKQRPIPILRKVTNATVAFTHTISNLYLKEEDPKNLVDKKITFFLEHIRTQFLLDTSNLNESFIERLALKSGNKISSTRYLIKTIRALSGRSECSNDELMRLNSMIEIYLKQ